MTKGYILYLRTDIWDTELVAGGSVAHTLGVINGFIALGHPVVCASSCLDSVFHGVPLETLVKLSNPSWLKCLRWKMNCFLSSFFFFFQTKKLMSDYPIACIYQRYSLLNLTGVFLAKWYKKKFILEYNCSEVWTAFAWASKTRLNFLIKPLSWIERYTIRQADYLVVVSEILKSELISWGIPTEKILVNPNGVDAEYFDPERIKRECMQ